jgi:DNA mismatch repair protein MSH5
VKRRLESILNALCSHLLSTHELGQLLDEEMTEAETDDLKEAEIVCRKFLAWDLDQTEKENVVVKGKLAEVLGRPDVR